MVDVEMSRRGQTEGDLINFAIRRNPHQNPTETVSLELKLVAINCVHVVGATFGFGKWLSVLCRPHGFILY